MYQAPTKRPTKVIMGQRRLGPFRNTAPNTHTLTQQRMDCPGAGGTQWGQGQE